MYIVTRLFLAFVLGIVAVSANATLMLSLDDNLGSSFTVTNIIDSGVVSYTGGLGDWTIYNTFGLANPAIGSEYVDQMHLNFLGVSGGAGGTLTIMLTQTDMSKLNAPYMGSLGGVSSGNIDFQLFVDSSNTAFAIDESATAIKLFDTTVSSSGGFGDNFSGGISFDDLYSITMVATITHGSAAVSSFDYDIKIPEPTSILLLSIGLLGLGIFGRRKIKAG